MLATVTHRTSDPITGKTGTVKGDARRQYDGQREPTRVVVTAEKMSPAIGTSRRTTRCLWRASYGKADRVPTGHDRPSASPAAPYRGGKGLNRARRNAVGEWQSTFGGDDYAYHCTKMSCCAHTRTRRQANPAPSVPAQKTSDDGSRWPIELGTLVLRLATRRIST